MTKYRFKTKEEFIRDGLWDEKYNCPNNWASDGEMNEYLGIDVPDECIVYCDKNEKFTYDGWLFQNTDYILKEQQEYFDDLSQHIGRYIRALVDNPHLGSGVKKGDVGKIISYEKVDFPNHKGYNCTSALNKNNLGVKYELLPEDYSPEQEDVPKRISFYVKYTEEFTEDLYNALWEWSKKNSEFLPRGFSDSYEGLKKHKFYIFDNWTLNSIDKYGGLSSLKYSYGVDNNRQNCKEEYTIEQVKKLIGYKEPSIEFIPGKWYHFTTMKGKYNLYVKVDFFTNEELYFTDGRYICNKSYDYASSIDVEKIENPRLVEDLSEIQEYLPEGHPDKVKNFKLEVGKWYKWYQKNHGNYHYGKVEKINLETDTLVMSPWIIQCDEYHFSGYFALSKAEQIQEISIEEVQEFLPKNYSDKITSDEFKKGEYIVIIKMIESYSKDFTSNYIYKQREDYKHLRSELDNYGSTTNGWETIGKKDSHTWRYATQEEIDEYERRGKPYNVTELQKKELSMKEIQEECKRRFPIGCTFTNTKGIKDILKDDIDTYKILGNNIWAHRGAGCLFSNGKWAELVSLPEENNIEVPEYIECFIPYGKAIKGKVYKTTDENEAGKLFNLSWKNVLIDFGRLKDGYFKISNKESYEKQKSSVPEYIEAIDSVSDYFISGKIYKVKNSNNLTSAVLNCNDLVNFSEHDNLYVDLKNYKWKPSTKKAYEQQKLISVEEPNSLSGSSKSDFILDEVSQYLSTAFDYWENVPKFIEKEFDIYGPTPDIN